MGSNGSSVQPPEHPCYSRFVKLKYSRLPGLCAICRLPADAPLPAVTGAFTSITRTDDELSIVCPEESIPAAAQAEKGWIALKLLGTFPFSQTGILAAFVHPLAEQKVPVFAISTFDTDYVLVKEAFAGMAMEALGAAGHELL